MITPYHHSNLAPIATLAFGLFLLGAFAPDLLAQSPVMVQDARILDDATSEKHGPQRKYQESDLADVGIVNFKNDVGTRVGVFNKSSKGPNSWVLILNGEIFADIVEVKREDSAIYFTQENSIEEYKLDLKTGRIFNRNTTDQRVWAQILEMTMVTLITTK